MNKLMQQQRKGGGLGFGGVRMGGSEGLGEVQVGSEGGKRDM